MPSTEEKKILTSFFIEKSLKDKLQKKFTSMGLGWAGGIRLALREFDRNTSEENKQEGC